ncbi:hypothetical protein [Sorangium cellulosum]|uniref:Uncharacterized protein n=1 Tax=Sorangium cellulosum TaxID=56 RepID=A0A150R187_SORCE|nr:hypothetical protein [Sorangium cellulosum]KYF73962.1 hypothetical protein BE15_03860 [Sorangium cellulosum]
MYKALALGSVLLATLCHVERADAQETGKQRGVITLAEVTITGRIQKPIAAVDVSRIQPKLTLAELRQPFLDRIEQAIFKEPF